MTSDTPVKFNLNNLRNMSFLKKPDSPLSVTRMSHMTYTFKRLERGKSFGDLKVDGKSTLLLLSRGYFEKKCSYISNLPHTFLECIVKYLSFRATLGKNI